MSRTRPPLHTLIVHFPFVLLGMSFVFDVASIWRGPTLVEAALFNLVAGLAAAAAAAVTGWWDYFTRLPAHSTARRIARWHASANALAVALFVCSLIERWPSRGIAFTTPRLPFVLSALGVAILGIAHYLGGLVDYELVITTRRQSPDAH
ncbi:MAG: Rieske (2Fe-2S) domain protein [Myxococcales bacterium]|nr:Rieske (2Fe-2S) domain protein [Myxococcales bacterium]